MTKDRSDAKVDDLKAECRERSIATKSKETKGSLIEKLEDRDLLDSAVRGCTPRQMRRIRKRGL